MAISAAMVKELRDRTNAGMMDCKRALEEAGGDMEQAVDILRQRGIAKGKGRGDRVAKEGLIVSHVQADGRLGVLLEVNSETDFVARTDEFQGFASGLAAHLAASDPLAGSPEELMAQPFIKDPAKSVQDLHAELVAKCGENVTIRRFIRYVLNEGAGTVTAYIHTGSKLGVLLEVDSGTDAVAENGAFQTLARDLAMHIAASAPLAVSREELAAKDIERERRIYREQALEEGKPEKVLDRIVEGRLEKYYQDVCLLEQPFVKDPDQTVKDLLAEFSAGCGAEVEVRRFVRYVLGEES